MNCHLTDLSLGGCYLTTNSPFPRGTRVTLSIKTLDLEVRAGGVVLVAHPEFGMGVEFLQTTTEQRHQVHRMITLLRANGDKSPELQVEPDGLDMSCSEDGAAALESSVNQASANQAAAHASANHALANHASKSLSGASEVSGTEDALVDLFRQQFQVPVETFLQQMREQRQSAQMR